MPRLLKSLGTILISIVIRMAGSIALVLGFVLLLAVLEFYGSPTIVADFSRNAWTWMLWGIHGLIAYCMALIRQDGLMNMSVNPGITSSSTGVYLVLFFLIPVLLVATVRISKIPHRVALITAYLGALFLPALTSGLWAASIGKALDRRVINASHQIDLLRRTAKDVFIKAETPPYQEIAELAVRYSDGYELYEDLFESRYLLACEYDRSSKRLVELGLTEEDCVVVEQAYLSSSLSRFGWSDRIALIQLETFPATQREVLRFGDGDAALLEAHTMLLGALPPRFPPVSKREEARDKHVELTSTFQPLTIPKDISRLEFFVAGAALIGAATVQRGSDAPYTLDDSKISWSYEPVPYEEGPGYFLVSNNFSKGIEMLRFSYNRWACGPLPFGAAGPETDPRLGYGTGRSHYYAGSTVNILPHVEDPIIFSEDYTKYPLTALERARLQNGKSIKGFFVCALQFRGEDLSREELRNQGRG